MNYKFPTINTIDDVLPHIEGRDEFIVVEKDDYIVINYVVMKPETFSRDEEGWEIRHECRGLIFSLDGRLISRAFHKFFNINENLNSQEFDVNKKILSDDFHMIYEKVDGSMVRPLIKGELIRLGTKMGVTDTSLAAEHWLANQKDYTEKCDWFREMHKEGLTPIFEWVSPKNRIVIDYGEENLILTAIRETFSGRYLSFGEMAEKVGKVFHVCPVYGTMNHSFSIEEYIENIRDSYDREGDVIRFSDGHMIKIKSKWYLDLHRIKAQISHNRGIISLYRENKLDDILSMLDSNEQDKINEFISKFERAFLKRKLAIINLATKDALNLLTNKEVALKYKDKIDKRSFGLLMNYYRNMESEKMFDDSLEKSLGSNTKFDQFLEWINYKND